MKPKKLKPAAVKVSKGGLLLWAPVTTSEGVVVVSDTKMLFGVDPSVHEVIWKTKVGYSGPWFALGSSVLVAGDGVSMHEGSDGRSRWGPFAVGACRLWGEQLLGTRPVAVLDAETGTALRRFEGAPDDIVAPLVDGDVLLGERREPYEVLAYDLGAGRLLWQRDLVGEAAARANRPGPAMVVPAGKDLVLVSNNDFLGAARLRDGSLIWAEARELDGHVAVGDGRAYILLTGSGKPARLQCVDLSRGEVVYEVPQPVIEVPDRSVPGPVTDGVVTYSTDAGLALAFRAEDGALLWWFKHRGGYVKAPVLHGGRALSTTTDGKLLVVDLPEKT